MQGDDKLLLGLTPAAADHVLEFQGRPCPGFNVGTGCPLCAEVTKEARDAIDAMKAEEEREGSRSS